MNLDMFLNRGVDLGLTPYRYRGDRNLLTPIDATAYNFYVGDSSEARRIFDAMIVSAVEEGDSEVKTFQSLANEFIIRCAYHRDFHEYSCNISTKSRPYYRNAQGIQVQAPGETAGPFLYTDATLKVAHYASFATV